MPQSDLEPIKWSAYWLWLKDQADLGLVTQFQFIVGRHPLPLEIPKGVKTQLPLGPAAYALSSVLQYLSESEHIEALQLLINLDGLLGKK